MRMPRVDPPATAIAIRVRFDRIRHRDTHPVRTMDAMLPKVDLSDVADELKRLGDEIQRAAEESVEGVDPAPQVLIQGLTDLLDTLRATDGDVLGESDPGPRLSVGLDPSVLLAHGVRLFQQLADDARRLGLRGQADSIDVLIVPFACWLLRRGGELQHPEGVVHALATLANRLRDPEDLAVLYGLLQEVADGFAPDRIQGMDSGNPGDPWRILLINRGIVATRSHQPALMEAAFDAIVEQLPDDAPHFFREGMGQMEVLDYPPSVREVMKRYFNRWCSGQRLH
jgi:hypothetical protein